jgi:hypothetical protein
MTAAAVLGRVVSPCAGPAAIGLVLAFSVAAPATGHAPAARLKLSFGPGHRSHLVAPVTVRPEIDGTLWIRGRRSSGLVSIIQQAAASPPQTLGSVPARRNGSFTYRLPPGGTRDVFAVASGAKSNVLHEDRSALINFRASPRHLAAGHNVHFSGSAPETAGVRVWVALQVRFGPRYQTFDLLETDTAGNFQGSFMLTTPDTRFVFRAYIPAQNGFTLAPSTSSTISVRVK